MPIDAASMLMPLRPLTPIGGAGGDSSMERQRLALLRQQFEEQKRSNQANEQYRRESEAGEMRRAEMQVERERAAQKAAFDLAEQKADADASAAQATEQRKLMGEMSKYRDAGDIEGIEALIPAMQAVGLGVERLGQDESGLPTYRFDNDPGTTEEQEYARTAVASPYGEGETAPQSLNRLSALGYDLEGQERGNLDEPTNPAAASTEDMFGAALAASQYAKEHGDQPLRGPDAPDLMGGVRKDTIDFGAMQSQAARRLDPALGALQSAYPERYQDSVGKTNEAAAGMALPAPAALKQAQDLRQGPDAAIARELAAEDKKAEIDQPLSRKDIESLVHSGNVKAKEIYDNRVALVIERSDAANKVIALLEDGDPNNDYAIAFQLPNMLGSRGAQSNRDVAVALGAEGLSTIDQIMDWITNKTKGGIGEDRKKSLIGVVRGMLEKDDDQVYDYLDAIEESAGKTPDPDVARGLREYARGNVPQIYREAWLKEKGVTQEDYDADPSSTPGHSPRTHADAPAFERRSDREKISEIVNTLAQRAELAGDTIMSMIGGESGGDASAKNKKGSSAGGLLQFLDKTAQAYTNPHTGKKFEDANEFKALPAEEQIPIYIQYFKDKGIDRDSKPEDYALAIAAPAYIGKAANTPVYKKGTEEWEKNPAWRPADGGDITVGSIVAYYNKHGLGGSTGEPAASPKPAAPGKTHLSPEETAKLKTDIDGLGGAISPAPPAAAAPVTAKSRADQELLDLME